MRIPLAVFDRIVTELQLPESQRRKIRLAADTSPPPYQGRPPPLHTTWQRPFSPPRHTKQRLHKNDSKEELTSKIKSQIERNRHLLERVDFHENKDPDGYHSDTSMDQKLGTAEEYGQESKEPETFDVGVGTEDFGECLI